MLKKIKRIILETIRRTSVLDKKKESAYFPLLEADENFTKLFLIIGPESTATRLITRILSQHPKVKGTLDASEHVDLLDEVWRNVEAGDLAKAKTFLPQIRKGDVFVTRRSMPHSLDIHKSAEYLKFPDLFSFYRFCSENKISLHVFVTSRSPVPTFVSSVFNRDSVSKSMKKAKLQYMASYMHLFEAIIRLSLPFSVISLEALLNDKEHFVNSLFELMGLEKTALNLDLHTDINLKKYEWFTANRD